MDKKVKEESCYFCKYYVQPENKVGVRYDACCFGHDLHFEKRMSDKCDLFASDNSRSKKQQEGE